MGKKIPPEQFTNQRMQYLSSISLIEQNLRIQLNVISEAYKHGCKRLMNYGSSCIYPSHCPQPIKEEFLMTGPLEETNDAYAMAKIAGIYLCKAYKEQYGFDSVCLMPTNVYGERDNFSLENSHVFPAFIRKFHEAKVNKKKEVVIFFIFFS